MLGSQRLYMLTRGLSAGEARPCFVVRDNGDGTVELTVLTLGPADGLDQHGLLRLSGVDARALGDDEGSAVANGRAVIREARDRLRKEASTAKRKATQARKKAGEAETAIGRAERDAREAEAEAERKRAELERMEAEAERWSEEAEAESGRAERIERSAPPDPHGDAEADETGGETPTEPQGAEP